MLNLFFTIPLQWRRQDFRGGGGATPRPLKGYHAPPAVGPGGLRSFIFKRFNVLENESIFQKYQHFACPKNPFFLRKIPKN